jgi:4-hydroxybutyryl-CoA dehydratase/vinylacetyl-CoA-Delta-isomerase
VQDEDRALGIAMTDAKGDRSRKPHQQAHPDSYVHVVERHAKGIVISGTNAIVTGAPCMHEFLVMPCRDMGVDDAAFAVCCAVPVDAAGITIVARPAGRPGEKVEHGAPLFSRRYGQSTGVVIFDRGVLRDETRAITRNRQPGRCCDTGCTQPGQAVMVPLPTTSRSS